MRYVKLFEEFINEKKIEWKDSDAPEADGRFRDLNPKELAAWLIKTRKGDLKKISGSLTQQIVFNRNSDTKYADKMEKTREEVYKQLDREDLLDERIFFDNILAEGVADGLLDDISDEDLKDFVLDIDIELEDEKGNSLDDDPEETGDMPGEEGARPPRLKKKQRKANAVKARVTRELLGPDSNLRPIIDRIFKKIEMEMKKTAAKEGVPINQINLDRIAIKR